jgi:hypothetical protein
MKSRLAVLSIAVALLAGATEPTPETRRWWSHIQALANDGMEGRDTGSEGYRKAARYLVSQFDRLGLRPAGEKGFYQPVPMHSQRLNTEQSPVELASDTRVRRLDWLRQITVTADARLPQTIDAPLVFIGSAGYAKELTSRARSWSNLMRP